MRNLAVMVAVFMFLGCASMRPPGYKEPESGDVSYVNFVNLCPFKTAIHVYEDAEACGQKKCVIWVPSGRILRIKVKANTFFTYSQNWEKIVVDKVTIDYFGSASAISHLEYCMVMNSFMPKPNIEYIVEYMIPKSGGCKYNIYYTVGSERKIVPVYEREFTAPMWETGDFCEPLDMNYE